MFTYSVLRPFISNPSTVWQNVWKHISRVYCQFKNAQCTLCVNQLPFVGIIICNCWFFLIIVTNISILEPLIGNDLKVHVSLLTTFNIRKRNVRRTNTWQKHYFRYTYLWHMRTTNRREGNCPGGKLSMFFPWTTCNIVIIKCS